MSQRFPDHFDGILAVAPGLNIPKAMAGAAWDTQALAGVAKAEGLVDASGLPLINKTFTDDDLALTAKSILTACDLLDGLTDGIIDDRARCTTEAVLPRLTAATCTGAKQPACLTAAQVAALQRMFAGPTDSQGRALYADWPWDAGVGGKAGATSFTGWRNWKLGPYQASENAALNVGFVASASAAILTTPPVPRATYGPDLVRHFLDYPLDAHAGRTAATTGLYRESVDSFMRANGTDLAAFARRGGKLIVVHGASDPISRCTTRSRGGRAWTRPKRAWPPGSRGSSPCRAWSIAPAVRRPTSSTRSPRWSHGPSRARRPIASSPRRAPPHPGPAARVRSAPIPHRRATRAPAASRTLRTSSASRPATPPGAFR